jgi:glyoxylase-like metal-dependent hydrolase (beta-lactamase superfamily II)
MARRLPLAPGLALCALLGSTLVAQTPPPAPTPQSPGRPATASLEPGVLPRAWNKSGPKCTEMPAFQVHEYNPSFFILRQSGCIHFEKPFLYLIFGRDKALLEDTGAGQIDTAPVVMDLVAKWAKRNNRTTPMPLLVVHSHSHGDHTAGDAGFKSLPNVQLVPASVPELQKAFGIANWPTGIVPIDLGGRIVDLIPIPGHDVAGIALYDRQTGILLTGDSFYPGRLYVSNDAFPAFVASHRRMVDFTEDKPVAHILGTHIEQTNRPFVDYPRGTVYQPDEHVLELTRDVLLELNQTLAQLNGKLERVVLRDMTLSPLPLQR